MTDQKCNCCPECGSKEVVNVNLVKEGYRECRKCGQEWWTDIEYDSIHCTEKEYVVVDPETCDDVFQGTEKQCIDYCIENDINCENIQRK